jgi:PAS domain S-box-containing protein
MCEKCLVLPESMTHSCSESKLVDALFDENQDMIILATENLTIAKMNRSVSIFFGISSTSLVGQQLDALLDSSTMARLRAITKMLSIDGETGNIQLNISDYLGARYHLAAGIRYIQCDVCTRRYFLFVLRYGKQPRGSVQSYINFRKLVERFLKGLSESVLLIDVESRTITECNEVAESMFGYSRDEMLGRSPQFLAASEDLAKDYVARSREIYAKAGFFQEKILCRRKDGSIFVTQATNIAFPSGLGEQKFILAINRDLSQEERRLDDIIRLSEQSRQLVQTLNDAIRPLKDSVPFESLSSLGFSRREIEIATILLTGETTKVIADRLKITESAVKSHLSSMYRHVGVSSRMEFLKYTYDHQTRIE